MLKKIFAIVNNLIGRFATLRKHQSDQIYAPKSREY